MSVRRRMDQIRHFPVEKGPSPSGLGYYKIHELIHLIMENF